MRRTRWITVRLSLDRISASKNFVLSIDKKELATLSLGSPAIRLQVPVSASIVQLQSEAGEVLGEAEIGGSDFSPVAVTFEVNWPADRLVRIRRAPREIWISAHVSAAAARPAAVFRYSNVYIWGRLTAALLALGFLVLLPERFTFWWQAGLIAVVCAWLLTCLGDLRKWFKALRVTKKPLPTLEI